MSNAKVDLVTHNFKEYNCVDIYSKGDALMQRNRFKAIKNCYL